MTTESRRLHGTVISRLPVLCALVGAAIGFGHYAAETGVVVVLTGYFLAKSVQSVVWTMRGVPGQ